MAKLLQLSTWEFQKRNDEAALAEDLDQGEGDLAQEAGGHALEVVEGQDQGADVDLLLAGGHPHTESLGNLNRDRGSEVEGVEAKSVPAVEVELAEVLLDRRDQGQGRRMTKRRTKKKIRTKKGKKIRKRTKTRKKTEKRVRTRRDHGKIKTEIRIKIRIGRNKRRTKTEIKRKTRRGIRSAPRRKIAPVTRIKTLTNIL